MADPLNPPSLNSLPPPPPTDAHSGAGGGVGVKGVHFSLAPPSVSGSGSSHDSAKSHANKSKTKEKKLNLSTGMSRHRTKSATTIQMESVPAQVGNRYRPTYTLRSSTNNHTPLSTIATSTAATAAATTHSSIPMAFSPMMKTDGASPADIQAYLAFYDTIVKRGVAMRSPRMGHQSQANRSTSSQQPVSPSRSAPSQSIVPMPVKPVPPNGYVTPPQPHTVIPSRRKSSNLKSPVWEETLRPQVEEKSGSHASPSYHHSSPRGRSSTKSASSTGLTPIVTPRIPPSQPFFATPNAATTSQHPPPLPAATAMMMMMAAAAPSLPMLPTQAPIAMMPLPFYPALMPPFGDASSNPPFQPSPFFIPPLQPIPYMPILPLASQPLANNTMVLPLSSSSLNDNRTASKITESTSTTAEPTSTTVAVASSTSTVTVDSSSDNGSVKKEDTLQTSPSQSSPSLLTAPTSSNHPSSRRSSNRRISLVARPPFVPPSSSSSTSAIASVSSSTSTSTVVPVRPVASFSAGLAALVALVLSPSDAATDEEDRRRRDARRATLVKSPAFLAYKQAKLEARQRADTERERDQLERQRKANEELRERMRIEQERTEQKRLYDAEQQRIAQLEARNKAQKEREAFEKRRSDMIDQQAQVRAARTEAAAAAAAGESAYVTAAANGHESSSNHSAHASLMHLPAIMSHVDPLLRSCKKGDLIDFSHALVRHWREVYRDERAKEERRQRYERETPVTTEAATRPTRIETDTDEKGEAHASSDETSEASITPSLDNNSDAVSHARSVSELSVSSDDGDDDESSDDDGGTNPFSSSASSSRSSRRTSHVRRHTKGASREDFATLTSIGQDQARRRQARRMKRDARDGTANAAMTATSVTKSNRRMTAEIGMLAHGATSMNLLSPTTTKTTPSSRRATSRSSVISRDGVLVTPTHRVTRSFVSTTGTGTGTSTEDRDSKEMLLIATASQTESLAPPVTPSNRGKPPRHPNVSASANANPLSAMLALPSPTSASPTTALSSQPIGTPTSASASSSSTPQPSRIPSKSLQDVIDIVTRVQQAAYITAVTTSPALTNSTPTAVSTSTLTPTTTVTPIASSPKSNTPALHELEAVRRMSAYLDRKDANGSTILMHAIWRHRLSHVTLLVQLGASLTLQDSFGNTPLHLACLRGHDGILQQLIAHGARLDVVNLKGRAPYELPSTIELKEVLRIAVQTLKYARTYARDDGDATKSSTPGGDDDKKYFYTLGDLQPLEQYVNRKTLQLLDQENDRKRNESSALAASQVDASHNSAVPTQTSTSSSRAWRARSLRVIRRASLVAVAAAGFERRASSERATDGTTKHRPSQSSPSVTSESTPIVESTTTAATATANENASFHRRHVATIRRRRGGGDRSSVDNNNVDDGQTAIGAPLTTLISTDSESVGDVGNNTASPPIPSPSTTDNNSIRTPRALAVAAAAKTQSLIPKKIKILFQPNRSTQPIHSASVAPLLPTTNLHAQPSPPATHPPSTTVPTLTASSSSPLSGPRVLSVEVPTSSAATIEIEPTHLLAIPLDAISF